MQEPVLASALAAMAGVCWQPPSRHVTLHLPRLEELNTDCSVLQGLLPHVVSLIQQGKEVPSGFSLLESYLLIGGPSVLAPVRGEIASVLQQTAERVLVAMSPREARIALWLRSAFCASQLRTSRRCWECQAVLLHGLLRRQVTASHFVGLALLLSACLIQQVYNAALSQHEAKAALHSTMYPYCRTQILLLAGFLPGSEHGH